MNVVVIGGHTRNIGKTSVMCALIREFSSFHWTAVKVTQYGHGVCSHDGKPCGCAPAEHPFALTEETNPEGRADTCRYLAAGARQSLWLRARQGQLASALPLLFRKLRGAEWVIIESNSILEFIEPLLYLVVLNGSRHDFKPSAQKMLVRADAFVSVGTGSSNRIDESLEVSTRATIDASIRPHLDRAFYSQNSRSKPVVGVQGPHYWSPTLAAFVRRKLDETIADGSFARAVSANLVHAAKSKSSGGHAQ
jgi:hypothetical protein